VTSRENALLFVHTSCLVPCPLASTLLPSKVADKAHFFANDLTKKSKQHLGCRCKVITISLGQQFDLYFILATATLDL
jgi:hypothetical protein